MHYSTYKLNLKLSLSGILLILFGTVKLIAQPLSADAGLSQTICDGSGVTIGGTPTASFGAGGYTYSWAPATGLSSTTVSNPTASPSSTVTYTVTVQDVLLAVATSTVTVTVNPLPTVNPTLSPFVCTGATVSGITFNSTPGGATFDWTNSNPSIGLPGAGSGNMPSFTATNTGSTTIGGNISVTATLAGCTGPAYVYSVTVKPKPIATSSPMNQTTCSGIACNFALSSTVVGTTFTWTPFGSGTSGYSGGSGTVIAQMVTTPGPGNGSVTYTITPTAAGCVGSNIVVNLTVNPIPVATATTSPLTRCSGDTVSFSVSCPVPSTTFTWTTSLSNVSGVSPLSGTGNTVFDTINTTTAAAGTAVYLFTPVAAGCTGSPVFPFVNVNPYPDATFSYAAPACQNNPNIFPTFGPGASAGTFTIFPAGVVFNSGTGEIDLTASTPGGYSITNTIAAAGGCPSVNVNTGFSIEPYIDPSITDVTYACLGSPYTYVAASTGGIWSGTGITNFSTGAFDPDVAGPGTYTISYTTPGPCFYNDVSNVTVLAGDISGNVTYSGGAMNAGTNTAVLFAYTAATPGTFDTVTTTTLDAFGNYTFTAVYPGNYIVEIYADTTVYPLAVPTYYPSEFLWDTAGVIVHGCSPSFADVFVIEGVVTAGPGMISGYVVEGAGFVRTPGDPIPGLDVKLGKNPGGAMVTNTQTNNPTGAYAFSNLPINSPGEFYTVYVDVPGLTRDSVWNITVTAINTSFTNINYIADSNSVYPFYPVFTSIVSADNENNLNVFPNPTKHHARVDYVLTKDAAVRLEIYDVLGHKVETLVDAQQSAGKYKFALDNLDAGIYFINLNINNNTNTKRLVVTD